jgi:hypothetical protein
MNHLKNVNEEGDCGLALICIIRAVICVLSYMKNAVYNCKKKKKA